MASFSDPNLIANLYELHKKGQLKNLKSILPL